MIEGLADKLRYAWGYLFMLGVYSFTGASLYFLWFFKGKSHARHKTCYMLDKLLCWVQRDQRKTETREGAGNAKKAEG